MSILECGVCPNQRWVSAAYSVDLLKELVVSDYGVLNIKKIRRVERNVEE